MTTNTAALLAEFRELNAKRPEIPYGFWVTAPTPHEINQQEAARKRWHQFCDTHSQALIESQAQSVGELKEMVSDLEADKIGLQAELAALRAELAETHDAMHGLMPGLDECWVLSQEGIIAFQRAHGLICQREKTTRAAVLAAVAKQETGK